MLDPQLVTHLLSTVIYAVVGVVIFAIAFWLVEKLTPFSVVKEIEEEIVEFGKRQDVFTTDALDIELGDLDLVVPGSMLSKILDSMVERKFICTMFEGDDERWTLCTECEEGE